MTTPIKSPFPGMDPFIENQEWKDFHTRLITEISDVLGGQIAPKYIARVERRVYVETERFETDQFQTADVALVDTGGGGVVAAAPTAATITPVECRIPMPEKQREAYLEIRDPRSKEVIAVIEILSPTNKRAGSNGREEYLDKRLQITGTRTHLVEIDLLRGGLRLPSLSTPPDGDYFAIISKGYQRPRAWTYAWPLEHRLPEISIPLRRGEDDASIDLQQVHDAAYANGRYDLSLDYNLPLNPPLSAAQQAWATELLSSQRQQ